MHVELKKQNVHHLKKKNNGKGFALRTLFYCNLVDGRKDEIV